MRHLKNVVTVFHTILSFVLSRKIKIKHVVMFIQNLFLWARKLKKKGTKENYITTFNTLKSGLLQSKKTILKIVLQKF